MTSQPSDDKALVLVLPQNRELVTPGVVEARKRQYFQLAHDRLAEQQFPTDQARAWAECQAALALCEVDDVINGAVKHDILRYIARHDLYRWSEEGPETLGEAIEAILPGVESRGMRWELQAVAEVGAWCEDHDIDVLRDPGRIGYVREAASALRDIIQSPGNPTRKAEEVKAELQFILEEAGSRDDVRARYRKYRGTPGTGTISRLEDGTTVMMIVATPQTGEAIRQKLAQLVGKWTPSEASLVTGAVSPSKIDDGQLIREDRIVAEQRRVLVIDAETGEILEEIN